MKLSISMLFSVNLALTNRIFKCRIFLKRKKPEPNLPNNPKKPNKLNTSQEKDQNINRSKQKQDCNNVSKSNSQDAQKASTLTIVTRPKKRSNVLIVDLVHPYYEF